MAGDTDNSPAAKPWPSGASGSSAFLAEMGVVRARSRRRMMVVTGRLGSDEGERKGSMIPLVLCS